jgi:hypothetical protein
MAPRDEKIVPGVIGDSAHMTWVETVRVQLPPPKTAGFEPE